MWHGVEVTGVAKQLSVLNAEDITGDRGEVVRQTRMGHAEIESRETLGEGKIGNEGRQQRLIWIARIVGIYERANHVVEAMIFHHDDENAIKVAAASVSVIVPRKRNARARGGSGKPQPHLLNKFGKNFAHSPHLAIMLRLPPRRIMLVDHEGELSVR